MKLCEFSVTSQGFFLYYMFSLATFSAFLTNSLSTTGLFLVFGASVLDSTAFLGFLMPGQSFVMLLGGLAQAGVVTWWKIITLISVGATVGDTISYFAGRYITTRNIIAIKNTWQDRITKTKQILDRGLISALLLDRFILPWRPIVPFAAGSVGIGAYRLLLPALVMNVSFAFLFTGIGYAIAMGLSLSATVLSATSLTYLSLIAFVIILSLSATYIAKLKVDAVTVKDTLATYRLIFKGSQWSQRITRAIPRTSAFTAKVIRSTGAVNLGIALVLLYLIIFVIDSSLDIAFGLEPEVLAVDYALQNFINTHIVPTVVSIFTVITQLGSTVAVVIISVLATALFWWRKWSRFTAPFLFSVTGAMATTHLLKIIIARPRSELAQVVEHTFSFPSGHTTAAFALYGFVLYVVWHTKWQWKHKVYASHTLVGLILLVSISRLYLGVHYLSDVLTGAAIGLSFVLLSILLFSPHRK